MMKLSYENSVHKTIEHRQKSHVASDNWLDLCEGLFGTIREKDNSYSLRGRVQISDAVCDRIAQGDSGPIILGKPQASYYPSYLEQPNAIRGQIPLQRGKDYTTFMHADAQIRGWKRYPLRKDVAEKHPIQDGELAKKYKIQTCLKPAMPGAEFTTKLRFHNLKPEELGAVIWALKLGDAVKHYHSLGMGKPLGYGQVSFTITGGQVRQNKTPLVSQKITTEQCLQYQLKFAALMDKQWQAQAGAAWLESPQLQHLLAMASPRPHDSEGENGGWNFNYMQLKEHAANKSKLGKNALPDFIGLSTGSLSILKDSQALDYPQQDSVKKRMDAINAQQKHYADVIKQRHKQQRKEQELASKRAVMNDNQLLVEELNCQLNALPDKQRINMNPLVGNLLKQALTEQWLGDERDELFALVKASNYLKVTKKEKLKERKAMIKDLMER